MVAEGKTYVSECFNNIFSIQNFAGGLITREDMRRYKATIRRPEEVIYTQLSNGRKICGPPPPSSSAVTQSIIKVKLSFRFARHMTLFLKCNFLIIPKGEGPINALWKVIPKSMNIYERHSGA